MKLNKIQNMLLGIAIGDAFGMTYGLPEDRESLKDRIDLSGFSPRMKKRVIRRPAGMYTDETQMSIALVELMLSDKEFNQENLADFFVRCYKRDPLERAYSSSTENSLKTSDSGNDFLQNADRNKISNGAAMRAVPLGILPNIDAVVQYATINAQTSHNTPQGIASSIAVALMSHYHFKYLSGISLFDYVEPHVRDICPELTAHLKAVHEMQGEDPIILFGEENVKVGVPMDGIRAVGAVIYILSRFDNPLDVLKETVLLGGYTDCTAAISLGANLIRHDVSELPPSFFRSLTNHPFGRDYILSLGERLAQKYPDSK